NEDATFECKLDGLDYAGCNSPKGLSGLADGSHTMSVRATDAAGNRDATPASVTWTVDTTAPETTIDASPAELTKETSARLTFSSEAGATFACRLDDADYASCGSPTALSGLKDGGHTFSVQATDAAGNTDETAASFDWTVDTVAPAVSFTDQPADPTNNTTAHFDFTSEADATFECSLDNEAFYSCQPPEHVPVTNRGHPFAVRA